MKNLINFISQQIQFPNVKSNVTKKLYAATPKTLLATFLLSTLFIYVFWVEVENKTILTAWFILLTSLSINRYYDYLNYKKEQRKNYEKWYNLFKLKATINSLLWGLTPIFFFMDISSSHQLIMVIFLTGLAGGMTGFIFDFKISSIFMTNLLIPIFIMLFFSDMPYATIIQFLLVIFYIILFVSNKHLNKLFYYTYSNLERYHIAKEKLFIKENKLSSLLKQVPIGIFYYDKNLKILSYNPMFHQIFGVKQELEGFDLKKLKDKKVISTLTHVLKRESSKEVIGSYCLSYHKEEIWVELTCSALRDDENNIIGGIGIVEDKTVEHKAYEQINFISLHDSLTALPNRRSYQEYMLELIQKERHKNHYSILLYMDLNHFKQVNDTFGHTIGDKLLLSVAKRLKSLDISDKYLSRIGGDEFILVLSFVETSPVKTKRIAKKIALEIKNLFNIAFEIEGLELYMTTSIGIVLIEPKSDDTEQIIRKADMAMYQTKREGLNNIRFYNPTLDVKQQELTSLQHDLKSAIDNNELELYYQPIVSIKENKLNAIESLIRWNHPTKGLVMPNMFIPMATESGLITKVGWWVAKEVCNQLSIWGENGLISFEYVSININARQLNEINFVNQIHDCIKNAEISPSLLKLELTETTLLDNFSKTQVIIRNLKAKGIECSIDDFGTGYSSLSYLKKFSFKMLKIDKIFTQNIVNNRDDEELVKSIIAIGKQFNYKIIIEGVETEEQKERLIGLDEDIYYQGYLCSKAIPAKEFEEKFLIVDKGKRTLL